jgi:hypothetical protein
MSDQVLDQARLLALFQELSSELELRGEHAQLFVVGGSAMALAYDDSRVTRDIDAAFQPAPVIREVAEVIGVRNRLSRDWLNDAAKGFMPATDTDPSLVFESEWLRVDVASAEYLLAMKLFSARQERDLDDAVTLWNLAGFTDPEQGLALLDRMYPASLLEPKHFYATHLVAEWAASGTTSGDYMFRVPDLETTRASLEATTELLTTDPYSRHSPEMSDEPNTYYFDPLL